MASLEFSIQSFPLIRIIANLIHFSSPEELEEAPEEEPEAEDPELEEPPDLDPEEDPDAFFSV